MRDMNWVCIIPYIPDLHAAALLMISADISPNMLKAKPQLEAMSPNLSIRWAQRGGG